ncbi:hypothetical protein ACPEIF_11515 [Streptomyces sp. NPDC012600]|uniref:hypothetical protein n=1 Tax=Streptomyces sp. NPDC012600 TaxID=3415005 RepID=UPI003C2DCD74
MVHPVKHLPTGILPEGGVPVWSVAGDGSTTRSGTGGAVATWPVGDAERWRKAGVPAVLAPTVGSWVLAALVGVAYVLLFGLSSGAGSAPLAWRGGAGEGTDWLRYPGIVLLTALPFWYRYVPVAAIPAALAVAAGAVLSLPLVRSGDSDRLATAGHLVVLAACAVAFTGSCLRLRARRRQRALALAAAGERRFPLPVGAPEADGHRGHRRVYLGMALCLVAAAILTEGLVGDLTASGAAYDAVGQQRIGLVLLVAGTTLYGRGLLAHRAARRLHEEDQPALIVGVRAGADGRHWVCADARTTSAAPLFAYIPRNKDTRNGTRLLGAGSVYAEGNGHHDIDPRNEPFEAVLYGTLAEGDEVILEYACAEYHRHQEMGRMYATVTTAPLCPDRRHGLGPWEPVDGPARQRERLQEAAKAEARRRQEQREAEERRLQREREAEERRRNPPPPAPPRPPGSRENDRSSRRNGGGCGSSCASSCGSGCGD